MGVCNCILTICFLRWLQPQLFSVVVWWGFWVCFVFIFISSSPSVGRPKSYEEKARNNVQLKKCLKSKSGKQCKQFSSNEKGFLGTPKWKRLQTWPTFSPQYYSYFSTFLKDIHLILSIFNVHKSNGDKCMPLLVDSISVHLFSFPPLLLKA